MILNIFVIQYLAVYIIEICLLTQNEKIKACEILKKAGTQFVKTSTGFMEGAKVEDVKLLKKYHGNVKAAGGIKNFEDVIEMIEAGAARIGTSSGVEIMKGFYEVEV